MEALALFGESLVPLLLFLRRHWFQSSGAAAFHYVEPEAYSHEAEVLHDLPASIKALDDDARESLPVEAGTVEQEAEPVEERLHERGDLKRVVRRREDHAIGRHDLLDEHVPVILKGTELLTLLEAQLATSTSPEPMVAQGDDLVLDITKRLQVVQELADGVICALLAGSSNERGDSLHVLTSITSLRMPNLYIKLLFHKRLS